MTYTAPKVPDGEKFLMLDTKLERQINYQAAAEQSRAATSDCLNIENRTPRKIWVGHVKKVDGQMAQEIVIVWRFAGLM